MNIYLSGAITSDKNFKKKFKKVESIIRKKFKGAGVINPTKISEGDKFSWNSYMNMSYAMLDACDIIIIIDGLGFTPKNTINNTHLKTVSPFNYFFKFKIRLKKYISTESVLSEGVIKELNFALKKGIKIFIFFGKELYSVGDFLPISNIHTEFKEKFPQTGILKNEFLIKNLKCDEKFLLLDSGLLDIESLDIEDSDYNDKVCYSKLRKIEDADCSDKVYYPKLKKI